MKRALVALSLAVLLVGGLAGCASCGKCCDGNPPCADCKGKSEAGCPGCKAAGGMCDGCKKAAK